jgi:NADP-dependent 3-hydroxy acid dehydrogenase YdfG
MSKTIVFITGANSGIGYETVKALVQSSQPYHVFLGSRSIENGNKAIEALQNEFPDSLGSIEVNQIDVSSDESINAAFEKVQQGPGHIDVLVNNAGTFPILDRIQYY